MYDDETALYYLQTRYYAPEMGRFINADAFVSTGQGILGNNMFAYCGNNPILFADYSGETSAAVRMITRFFLGSDLKVKVYEENSSVSKKIKNSSILTSKIEGLVSDYKEGKIDAEGTGSVRFDSCELDLWLGIRNASFDYSIEEVEKPVYILGIIPTKKKKTVYKVTVIVYDTYNFNTGDETGDGLGSILNNIGYYLQENGYGTEYRWEAVMVYEFE